AGADDLAEDRSGLGLRRLGHTCRRAGPRGRRRLTLITLRELAFYGAVPAFAALLVTGALVGFLRLVAVGIDLDAELEVVGGMRLGGLFAGAGTGVAAAVLFRRVLNAFDFAADHAAG